MVPAAGMKLTILMCFGILAFIGSKYCHSKWNLKKFEANVPFVMNLLSDG
jgi:hypothetical protein